MTAGGITVGAIVAVNAVGTVNVGDGPHFWAAPFEIGKEFGGLGLPSPFPDSALAMRVKGQPADGALQNTTIALVATDATLNKMQARRLAVMAQSGMSRAIYPVHTPLDGDTVFAAATGHKPLADPIYGFTELGMLAANVLARAIARGVYEASALSVPGALPSWRDCFAQS
jgi:D-aminopeptidase